MRRTLAVTLATLFLAACGAKPETTNAATTTVPAATPAAPTNPAAASADPVAAVSFVPALGVDLKTMTKTASGLYYKDLATGQGPEATAGKAASLQYVGTLPDGTRFDASPPGRPYTFTPGHQEVIAGWDEGVPGMRVGGKRMLVIPPALGYGPAGSGPIPPNAVLVFTVELVSVR